MRVNLFLLLVFSLALVCPGTFGAAAATGPTGTVVWKSGTLTTPMSSDWDGAAFGTADSTAEVGAWRIMVGAEAPTRNEIIVAGSDQDSILAAEIWDGATWAALPFNPLATVSNPGLWSAAVAYENQSGDAILVWNNGTADTTGLSYRVWDGTQWSSELTVDIPLEGDPRHLRLAADPNSDEMVLVVADSLSRDYALVWDGTDWGESQVLDSVGSVDASTDVGVTYCQASGVAVVVYGKGTTSVYYRVWTGAAWLDEASLPKPADAAGNVLWTALGSDPVSARIVLGVLTAGKDVWLSVWDGAAWELPQTATTSATGTTYPNVAVAFEGTSGEAIASYGESATVRYRTWASATGWSEEFTIAGFATGANTMILNGSPRSDDVMLSVQDNGHTLNAIAWDGDEWGPATEIEKNTGETRNQAFVFVWDRIPPSPDLDVTKVVDEGSPHVGDLVTYGVALANIGTETASGIELLDTLPAGLTYSDHVATSGSYDPGSGVWTLDSLVAGQNAGLAIEATVDDGTQGMAITNIAAVTGLDEPDFNSANDSAAVVITVFNQQPILDTIGPRSVDEGGHLGFTVTASDPDGTMPSLLAESLPEGAAFEDNGDGTGSFDFDPDFTQAGTYSVLLFASDGFLADSEIVAITVNEGPLAYIIALPDSAVVSADSSVQFEVTGYDAGGDEDDPGDIAWNLTAPIGDIDADGLFDATTVGTARVVAVSSEGPRDTTLYLEVIPGALDALEIDPNTFTISADSTRQFTVSGTDADGNPVGDLGTLTWRVYGGIGTIDGAGLFTATEAGTGTIKVTSSLGPWATTGTITVVPGAVASIDIEPSTAAVVEGSTCEFGAKAYDSDGNLIGDCTSLATWTTTDPGGSVTSAGLYTAGHSLSPPVYFVKASYSARRDSSTVTVISGGTLARVRVEWPDGTLFGDATLSCDNDTTKLYCRAYDSADHLIGDVSATWSLIGAPPIGTVTAGPSTSTTLRLTRAGTGRVAARYSVAISDTTGTITSIAGAQARIAVAPDTATVTAGNSLQFAASAYDADGNTCPAPTVSSWGVLGGVGTITSGGLFAGEHAGSGKVWCSSGSLRDTTGTIAVVAGALTRLEVAPDSVEIEVGGTATFDADGFDAYGNAAGVGTLTWSVIGGVGSINSAGTFTAEAPGSGRVAARSSLGGIADTTSAIIVYGSPVWLMVVSPDTASVRLSSTVAFTAHGFDAVYEPVDPGTLTWQVIGGIGTIDAAGVFTATRRGKGYIAATENASGIADTTGMIVVELPTIAEVPVGNILVHAGEISPVLVFQVHNAFGTSKAVKSVRVRDGSRGGGTSQNRLSNIHAVAIYSSPGAKTWPDPGFTRLAETHTIASTVTLPFTQVAVSPGSYRTFAVTVEADAYPRDSDSLDFFLLPSLDVVTADGTVIAGPDTINSLGFDITDGMIADQIGLADTGASTIVPDGEITRVLTADLPRNGYASDMLEIFTVFNEGSADTAAIDSMFLFSDDGDGLWERNGDDHRLGALSFTGGQWQASGLVAPLTGETQRFFVAARISRDAPNGTTLALGVPLHGIEVSSANDGPIDVPVAPPETIAVARIPGLSVRVLAIPARDLVPGSPSGPLLCLEFANSYTAAVEIDSISFDCYAIDPEGATRLELDGQIESVGLYLDRDGNHLARGPADTLIASAAVVDGRVRFRAPGLTVPEGGVATVYLEAALSIENCKNGNTLGFGVTSAQRIALDKPAPLAGSFPLRNPQEFPINIFPAQAATVHAVDAANLLGGQTDRVVFDFEMPANGYDADHLASLSIINTGTAAEASVLTAVRLWADTGEPGFTGDDALVGAFEHVGPGWLVSDLAALIPVGGRRFFITVDLAITYVVGGTIRFEIPVGGAGYLSGADGPDDEPIGALQSHLVLPADRITVIPIPREAGAVCPGDEEAQLLTFALYNGFASKTHELRGLRLVNQTVSVSTPAYADHELGQVSLYHDSNADHALSGDDLLAAGYFAEGGLSLAGLDVSLAPESLLYFFVVANPALDAIDGDTLSIAISGPSDLTFGEAVKTNGDFPVASGGPIMVDGSVSRQYEILPMPSGVAAPGDNAVTLLAVVPASNGDQADTLLSLRLRDEGDAAGDITSLHLWLDTDGDGIRGAADSLLGDFVEAEDAWEIEDIGFPVDASSRCLFVTGDVAPEATPGHVFRAVIPVGGCEYASGNDGPLDAALVADQAIVISVSEILLAYERLEASYSVGERICLEIDVANAMAVPAEDVICEIVSLGDAGSVVVDSIRAGPVDLASGEFAHFFGCYTAAAPGSVWWQVRAFSALPAESSAVVASAEVTVQAVPSSIRVEMVSSTPTSVARGQEEVFPMSIKYHHSDGSPFTAPVRLDSLRIRVEDGKGAPLAANAVFSRLVLSTGYINLAVIEDVPAEPSVVFAFSQPAVLVAGKDQVLSLHADVASNAAATAFALAIGDASSLRFIDCNSGDPVAIDPAAVFPLRTPPCKINNPTHRVVVTSVPLLGATVNYGQDNVEAMSLVFHHPGQAGESEVMLTGLTAEVTDETGACLAASELIERIELIDGGLVVGELDAFDDGTGPITIAMAAPPVLSPGESDTLRLRISLKAETPYSEFGLGIADSASFALRDLSSGGTVAAAGHDAGGEAIFPMGSGSARLLRAADAPQLCLESRLPASVVAGSASVALIRLDLAYPVAAGRSDVLVREVRVAILDTLARFLDPYEVFRRTGYRKVGELAAFSSSLSLRDGYTVFSLGAGGIRLHPGQQISLDLLADIEAVTPYGHMLLMIPAETGVCVVDATDPTSSPGLAWAQPCDAGLPFVTPLAQIVTPAGSPVIRISPLAPRLACPGQTAIEVLTAHVTYDSSSPQGDLRMTQWSGKVRERTATGLVAADPGAVFQVVRLVSDGEVVAADSVFADGGILLDIGDTYVLARGSDKALSLRCDLRADAAPGNCVIEFTDSTFASFLDCGLGNSVLPLVMGAAYPILTADISVSAASLAGSFTNWPNPFRPAVEATTIGYILAEDAHVDISIFTMTGDLVTDVASEAARSAGPHGEDFWTGKNTVGLDVVPGAYLCRISVRYASGRTEEAKRKVAVIR